jgi:hypothetical protein
MKLVLAVTLSVAAAVVAHAQTVRTPVAPAPMAMQADMLKWQSAMVAAQQAAIKPGDEALPCEALHKELVSSMNAPAIQQYAAKTDAAYARELAAQQKKGEMTAATAAALAASLASGPGMAGMTGMPQLAPGQQMTPQQMQQAMLAQQQASIAYMNQLAPIMPTLMRSQRVTQLAMMKNCAWATGGLGLYPNAVSPDAIPAITGGVRQR